MTFKNRLKETVACLKYLFAGAKNCVKMRKKCDILIHVEVNSRLSKIFV